MEDMMAATSRMEVVSAEHDGLTVREVEVLKWSAEGKTAAEVAMILELKTRTVNYHIGRAIQKFGVANKTCAVVKAARRGLF
ncbi:MULTISPECIES: helix-turn-helix transcriptional regulator [unclassified Pseudomonas]|uniref:helix-turn-helix domain-containing protein n=1 Tax=unclassified Pseudomonas TaxID=196821 RepID=UPI0008C37995|nr:MULTISPECIES: helix-turn-helix transcriptional regulator [unclassified Pseudomonas]SEJ96620.1 LuxR family transcriptional regulator [Pseudomonas sp. NFR16]